MNRLKERAVADETRRHQQTVHRKDEAHRGVEEHKLPGHVATPTDFVASLHALRIA
jgi:hypothetical protein